MLRFLYRVIGVCGKSVYTVYAQNINAVAVCGNIGRIFYIIDFSCNVTAVADALYRIGEQNGAVMISCRKSPGLAVEFCFCFYLSVFIKSDNVIFIRIGTALCYYAKPVIIKVLILETVTLKRIYS